MRAPIAILLVGALVGGRALPAQVPVRGGPPDSLRADSLRRLADTLSTTDRMLKAQKDQLVQLQPMPLCGTGPIAPAGTRIVFTRDSIDWAAAESLGELLQRVPGVFLEQSDWLGSPQIPNAFGRGASSVSYELDCVPMLPIGPDSVAVDPSPWSLDFLDRVEVEVAPGAIRVFLFTRRHDRAAPRTKIGVAQGDRGSSRYLAMFERRYGSGIGLGLGADYVGLNPSTSGTGGASIPSGWFQLGYVPTPRFGIQAQLVATAITRNVLLDAVTSDTLSRQESGTRADWQVRAAWRQRTDGLGRSLDLFYVHTSWSSDSAPGNQSISGVGAVAAMRQPTWSAQFAAWHYARQTPLDSRLDLGWAPTARLTGSLQLVAQQNGGNRSSRWATARVGIALPFGFRIGGTVSNGFRVQSPTVTDDVAQYFTDAQVTAGVDSRLLSLDVGYASDEGWRPQAFPEFLAIATLAPMGRTRWVTAHVRLAPTGFLTFETVYQNPVSGGSVNASPPQHTWSTATLRSRFLRNFPSGIFGLKLQGVMEHWGAGVGGLDAAGVPVPLPAATFFRAIIQIQLGPFIVYYDRANLKATPTGYVPGYPIQPIGGTFGARWEFSN